MKTAKVKEKSPGICSVVKKEKCWQIVLEGEEAARAQFSVPFSLLSEKEQKVLDKSFQDFDVALRFADTRARESIELRGDKFSLEAVKFRGMVVDVSLGNVAVEGEQFKTEFNKMSLRVKGLVFPLEAGEAWRNLTKALLSAIRTFNSVQGSLWSADDDGGRDEGADNDEDDRVVALVSDQAAKKKKPAPAGGGSGPAAENGPPFPGEVA